MALLDRVRARVETDLDDSELQNLIDEADAAITAQYGPAASPLNPVTITVDGRRRYLDVSRPIDTTQAVVIVETRRWYDGAYGFGGTDITTLAVDDYLISNGGRTVERVTTGVNPWWRWGTTVQITYTPVDDTPQRQEVLIKLVQLAVTFDGTSMTRVGDVTESKPGYLSQRDELLYSLSPRKGLLFR